MTESAHVLVRMVRRLTVADIEDPEEILDAAFSDVDGVPDLAVSAYLIERERRTQLRAEHCAGSGMDRPTGCGNIDLSGLHDHPIATNENAWFTHANTAHRELRFTDRQDLLSFIERWIAVRVDRENHVTPDGARNYVRSMHSVGDAEWARFFREHDKGPKWARLAKQIR